MPSALVLINCQSRFTPDVIESLRKLPELEAVYKIQGIYDVIARLKSENKDDLRENIVRLRQVAHITSTLTMIILREERAKEELLPRKDYLVTNEYDQQHRPSQPSSAITDSTAA